MRTPYDLGWGDPRQGQFPTLAYDIGEGVRLTVRNTDVGAVFAELVRRLMAAGWDGPADPVPDDWGTNWRLKRWAEAQGVRKSSAPLDAWSDHAWGTAIDLDTATNPMLDRRPADPWVHTTMPRETPAICAELGIEWGGSWSEPYDPQHFQIAMTPAATADMAARIHAGATDQEDEMTPEQAAQLRNGATHAEHADRVVSANAQATRDAVSRVETAVSGVRSAVDELTAAIGELPAQIAAAIAQGTTPPEMRS